MQRARSAVVRTELDDGVALLAPCDLARGVPRMDWEVPACLCEALDEAEGLILKLCTVAGRLLGLGSPSLRDLNVQALRNDQVVVDDCLPPFRAARLDRLDHDLLSPHQHRDGDLVQEVLGVGVRVGPDRARSIDANSVSPRLAVECHGAVDALQDEPDHPTGFQLIGEEFGDHCVQRPIGARGGVGVHVPSPRKGDALEAAVGVGWSEAPYMQVIPLLTARLQDPARLDMRQT